jgi:hypothetical protein
MNKYSKTASTFLPEDEHLVFRILFYVLSKLYIRVSYIFSKDLIPHLISWLQRKEPWSRTRLTIADFRHIVTVHCTKLTCRARFVKIESAGSKHNEKLRKTTDSLVMSVLLSLCLSAVSPRVISRLPLERVSRQYKMTTCSKTGRKNSRLVKDGQKYQALKHKHAYGSNSLNSSGNEKTFKKNCREIQSMFNVQYISHKSRAFTT